MDDDTPPGARRLRRWRNDRATRLSDYVEFGALHDGGWYVWRTGVGWVIFDHRDDAEAVARRLTVGWRLVPAVHLLSLAS